MSIPTYGEVGAQGLFLSPNVQVRFLEELVVVLGQSLEDHQRHSTLELRGLGQEFWRERDSKKHI